MRFTINLATRTYLDHRLINRLAYCFIAALFLLAGWNVSRVISNMGELGRLNTEISALQNKLGVKPDGISDAEVSRQKSRIRFYNEILEQKSIRWTALLELFENATPEGIALSALSPDKNPGEWKLDGRARSFKTVQQYLEKLEGSKIFSNVMLMSHQNILTGEKGHGIQFTISCRVMK